MLASIVFYAWGGVGYSFLLVVSLILNYVTGILTGRAGKDNIRRIYLTVGIVLNLSMLGVFKYGNFLVENINFLLHGVNLQYQFYDPGLILPIGISFYTFQAISYLIDVYKKKTPVQYNFINLALYISLFPQLIAGPIVRYNDICDQLSGRDNNLTNFSSGVERFVLGLAKKVILANQFAILADTAFNMPTENLSTFVAWAGLVAYTLQIYFDFSGYSDMAIGLGRMFGFKLLENFNFPYIAQSIREFWKRWHISLTNWFRDYLYFPLGGNRKGNGRTYLNLLIVFFITGIWHGASWNFVAWGLMHGFFMIIERLGFGKFLNWVWRPVRHIYTLFVVMMAWVLFRAEDFSHAWNYYKVLFSNTDKTINYDILPVFLNDEVYTIAVLGILSSTTIWVLIYNSGRKVMHNRGLAGSIMYNFWTLSILIFIVGVLVISTTYLVSNSYNPFIYFRF